MKTRFLNGLLSVPSPGRTAKPFDLWPRKSPGAGKKVLSGHLPGRSPGGADDEILSGHGIQQFKSKSIAMPAEVPKPLG